MSQSTNTTAFFDTSGPSGGPSDGARPARPGGVLSAQTALAAILALEIALFSLFGTNFLTVGNAFEITRLSVEIGLLAVALTPVILTGGIDLSVGSLMGLAAVVFGILWRDLGLPIPVAALGAIGLGGIAGCLNGGLITKLRIPPLIATLGTYSLFRGLAEGITRGVENYTDFPSGFLFLGQGYLFGVVPAQLPIFVVVALAFGLLVHRGTFGRGLVAIGSSIEGARYAGLRVDRILMSVYALSGLTAGLAAVIYVAHLGQAKADAGLGYELMAITAVVLGGTSIFGGRGSVVGTLLGLFAIATLQNGLRLADLAGELAGVFTGVLLLLALGVDRWADRASKSKRPERSQRFQPIPTIEEEWTVKNSQVAMICLVMIASAGLIAWSNLQLARSVVERSGTGAEAADASANGPNGTSPTRSEPITIAMMPKSKGNAYFIACREGAEEAAEELGVRLIWDGPTAPDPARQNQIIDTWITRGVDVIAVAVENRDGIASVLKKAQERGIRVITWDADAPPDSRMFFVNQATPEGIGRTLMDTAAEVLGGKGRFAIITASLTAANMIAWQEAIETRRSEAFPEIELAALRPCDDMQQKAYEEANTILNAYPEVELIMAICSPAVPGAAEAVKQSGREDVKVIGLGLPNDNRRYVHEGITEAVILWNTRDLGYLTVHAAEAVAEGTLQPGDERIEAGRLGTIEVRGDNILLGEPVVFDETNIDDFDF